jgi:uncharacterized cupin superfamily protein
MKKIDHIVNLDELELRTWRNGKRFEGQMGEIGLRLGTRQLGCNLTVVPAGKRAFPMHNHHVNEELFLILEGEGEIRFGDERFDLRAGDVVSCLTGGPETAHQIINTMPEGDLKYFAVSTDRYPDVVEYPDSEKTLVHHEWQSADGKTSVLRRIMSRDEGHTDYWQGED